MKITRIEKEAITLAISSYRQQTVTWIQEARALKSFGAPLSLSPMSEASRLIFEKSLIVSYLAGRLNGQEEIKGVSKLSSHPWDTVGYDQAYKILKEKVIIPPAEFKAVAAEIKAVTFSVQKMENMNALLEVKKSILKAIETGEILEDWKKKLPGVFERYGITPLSPHHIDTVYRTNLLSTYNQARFDEGMHSEIIVAFRYTGIDDGRHGNDACYNFFNKVFLKTDPIWQKMRPPNHYQCRCGLQYVSKFEMENMKESDKPTIEQIGEIHPDFEMMPAAKNKPMPVSAEGMKQYREKVEEAKKKKRKKIVTIIKLLALAIAAAKAVHEKSK